MGLTLTSNGTGDGIRVTNPTVPRDRLTIERVNIWYMGNYGLYCNPTQTQVFMSLTECR